MAEPRRIRLSRARGWRLPEGAVNVARPGKWGNPFVVGRDGDRRKCVRLYVGLLRFGPCLTAAAAIEDQLAARIRVAAWVQELRGKDLACHCPLDGGPCHADVLLRLANAESWPIDCSDFEGAEDAEPGHG